MLSITKPKERVMAAAIVEITPDAEALFIDCLESRRALQPFTFEEFH